VLLLDNPLSIYDCGHFQVMCSSAGCKKEKSPAAPGALGDFELEVMLSATISAIKGGRKSYLVPVVVPEPLLEPLPLVPPPEVPPPVEQ
jgi:hypothetical protein